MNEYLLKLALVVNTSHSKFIDNLTNIIIYVLYTYNSEGKQIKIEDLPKAIEKISGLEFTIKEIQQAIEEQGSNFYEISGKVLILTEAGNKQIHIENRKKFENIIKRYIEKYNISKQTEEVKKLIYEFLYNSVQNNIEALLNVATGTDSSQILAQLKKLDNEDRRIINDFIDWDDEQKNELLYEIISFAVDYCCLTIKKDKANFSTLLQGKTFYLDTNILFRMLGLNNEQRKETILQFVNKCKEAKIKLLITSFTKTETLNSIQYHVRQVKKIMQGYTGNGNALSRLYDKSNYEDSFLTVYLAWAMKNGIQGHYDDFHKYLQKEFYELVNEIRTVDAGNIQIPEGILESYISWKDGKITRENAEYDIKNLIFIDRIRKQKSNTMGWNVGEYLISADHKLIKWADRNFSKENPIAVLPSVWYSMLLKLQGRAQNDIKAFSEFIKIRYIQDKPTENIQYLINKVCEKTTNGALQDMLFDEIAKNNEQINELSFKGDEQIDEIVNQAYDDILETTKKEGYSSGEKNGRESGYKQGISRGEKIGRIKVEIEHLQSEISKNALKIRIRNIGITIFVTVLLFVACMFGMYKIPVNFLKNIKIAGKITISLISSGIVGKILWEIFPINLEEIKKIEKEKQQGKLDELDRALKIYEE
jgi:hypothetical protein